MKILDNHKRSEVPAVATVGFFDGVHLGHRFLIDQVRMEAERRGVSSLVVTFAEHPLKVIREGFKPMLLTTREEKVGLVEKAGVDSVALMDFTCEMSMLSAREFMEKVLRDVYNVRVLMIGYDHRFGHNRNEGFEDYVRFGKELGIEVIQNAQCVLNDESGAKMSPSSTLVRSALLQGDVTKARAALGYDYFLEGKVVGGYRNGRKMGYPTANIAVDDEKLVPANGVYLVRVGESHYGMLNIGTRPTMDNGEDRSVEVHIFDFDDDIYEQTLRIEFVRYIREERKFESVAMLQEQLAKDEKVCREAVGKLKVNS